MPGPQGVTTSLAAAPSAPASRRIRMGALWVDAVTFAEALERIAALVGAGRGGAVFTPNVDHVVTAEHDEAFRAAYQAADLSLADGQPLVWASRLLGTPVPEKISGADLVWPLMQFAARMGWRVYLLGGPPGVAERAAARLRDELGVRVVGVDAPRIAIATDAAPEDDDAVVRKIRDTTPDVVLVALGAPKQERWIHRNAPRLAPAVSLGVGASLDFLAGHVRRAPAWMSRAGLEWAFRLTQDPRRLAHRYLVKDPRFLLVLCRMLVTPRRERVRVSGRRTE